MEKAIFPGTFDPPTLGHLNAIERSARLVKSLYIAVGDNPQKSGKRASLEQRVEWLKLITSHLKNAHIVSFDGLLVDFAQQNGIKIVIRSIRGPLELEQETMQAKMNKSMTGLETLFLPSDMPHISSTLVREVASKGHSMDMFVPKVIISSVAEQYLA